MSDILPVGQRNYVVNIASVGTPDVAINCQGSGIAWHQLTWTKTGTVSVATAKLQQSSDGSSWSDLIASQDISSNGQSSVANVVANYIRIDPLTFTGTGEVTVTWNGYDQDPAGGGGGGIGGSIAAAQVAVGTGSDTIGGTNDFVWSSTTGSLQINEPGSGDTNLIVLNPGQPGIQLADPALGDFFINFDDVHGYVSFGPTPVYIENPVGVPANKVVDMSAAQIATWNSQPITLVAAPGAGKFIDVLGVTLSYKHNTVDPSNFSGTDDIEIAALAGQIPSNAYATGSSNGLAVDANTFPPNPNAQNNFQKLTVPSGPGNTYAPNVSYRSFFANNLPLVLLGNQDADGTGGIGTNSLNAGGLLYAVGDAFSISGVGASAYGYVDTVNGVTGAVLTYHLVNIGYGFTAPLTAVATTALTGSITAASVTSGNAGANYAVGDLFQIVSGDGLAYCQVASVDGSGAVLSFNLIWGGSTCSTGGGNSTQVLSGFGDGNLQVDIGSVQNSNGNNNFTIDIASLFLPDGTMEAIVTYTIQSL